MTRTSSVALLTAGLLLLPGVALAHPSLNPNAGPAGRTIESTLVVPHGCAPGGGMPESGGEASPTVELALQHTDGVTIDALPVDGWTSEDDGDALVWTDAGGATTEPIQLPVTITLTGETGDDVYVNAYQECANGEAFQWIATPDVEAENPAVYLAVADEVGLASAPTHEDGHDAGGTDHDATEEEGDPEGDGDHDAMDGMADDEASEDDADQPSEDAVAEDEPSSEEVVSDDATSEAGSEDGGGSSALLVVGVLAVLALGGVALALRGRRDGA